jgi:tetratricopeptide (TPR) repeat protein/O-antigen ligase
LLLALAVALPLIGGKLADWQTGLVALVAVLAAGSFVVGSLRRGGRGWGPRQAEDWALAALVALMAAAVFWAPYLHAALLAVLQVLSYALCFWVARAVLGGGRWGDALAGALALGGSMVALIALREYLATWRTGGPSEWRVFATFFNPNLVAGYLLVCLPAGVALVGRYWRGDPGAARPGLPPVATVSRDKPRKRDGRDARPTRERHPAPERRRDTGDNGNWVRPLALTAVVLMALALPLTGSKGGALGAVGAAIAFGWTFAPVGSVAGRRMRRWVLVLVAGVVALGLVAPPLRSRVVAAFSTQSNSTMFRYYTWAGMVRMIGARPLQGFGTGSFQWAYPPYAETGFTRLGHESYLQVATEAGLPALAAFLAVWVLLARGLGRRLGEASPPLAPLSLRERGGEASPSCPPLPAAERAMDRLLPGAALAAMVGFVVHNLVDYSWYCPAVAVSLFLLAGAATGDGKADKAGVIQPRASRAAAALAGLGALALVLVVFLVAQVRQAASQGAYRAGDLQAAVQAARSALALDPWDAESWDALAVAYYPLPPVLGRGPADLQQAIEARRQEARVCPTDPTNWRRLGLLYGEAHDLRAGLEALSRALAYNPNYVLGLADQARLAEQAGQLDLAAAAWERLAALYDTPVRKYAALELPDPTYLYAWDYLARQAESRGERPRALEYRRRMAPLLEQVLTLPPWEVALMESVAMIRRGDLESFRLMAAQTAAALRATGEKADAEEAGKLEKAKGN